MEITITKNSEQVVINLSGRLDTTNSNVFDKKIADLILSPPADMVVDCSELTYISSSGLRLFLSLQKSANEAKTTLAFRRINADIKEILDMTGFTQILSIENVELPNIE
ncbi:MAG: STAS domain-containing protein [Bacteroidales bacterium]|jgi:anti-sigma B factor antagonist/stage II sporulation protein AA (anti-sigma F factor antagonist)|nr:STAS domain-containing protein [Bacteroidales bacterium]